MRVLYAGLPAGALALCTRGLAICAALVAQRDRTGTRRLRRALGERGAPLLVDPDLRDEETRRILRSTKADALVSFFWPRVLPPEALGLAPLRLGVHPSLLPRHRGPDPIFWTILRGDARTGVTVHEITEEVDAGPILAQRERAVAPEATAGSLWRPLRRDALLALAEVLDSFRRGDPPEPRPQDAARATAAPIPSDEDLEIRWDRPADEILRLVRAASPDPGAYSAIAERAVTILDAAPTARRLEPGDAVRLAEGVCIGTATTAIRIVRTDPPDALREVGRVG